MCMHNPYTSIVEENTIYRGSIIIIMMIINIVIIIITTPIVITIVMSVTMVMTLISLCVWCATRCVGCVSTG